MTREKEQAIRAAWKMLLFDVKVAIKNINQELERLEAQMEIENRRVENALEEASREPIAAAGGTSDCEGAIGCHQKIQSHQ